MAQNTQNPVVGPLGPLGAPDNTETRLRTTRTKDLVVQPAHGEYYEAAARNNIWTISTAAAGVAITANMVQAVASANAIVGIYNPTSNINCHITRAVIVYVSGTAVTGGFCWGVTSAASNAASAITSAGVNGRNNRTYVKGGHQAIAFDGTIAVTGSGATVLFRYIGGLFPGAIGAGGSATFEETEEDLVVGPGAFAGIFGVASGTNTTVTASLSWEEIPA